MKEKQRKEQKLLSSCVSLSSNMCGLFMGSVKNEKSIEYLTLVGTFAFNISILLAPVSVRNRSTTGTREAYAGVSATRQHRRPSKMDGSEAESPL